MSTLPTIPELVARIRKEIAAPYSPEGRRRLGVTLGLLGEQCEIIERGGGVNGSGEAPKYLRDLEREATSRLAEWSE